MTKHEATVITAFTGITCGSFSDFHEYVERLLERPVWTHEFASKELCETIKEKARADFLEICNNIK